jgi:hypothetical protein
MDALAMTWFRRKPALGLIHHFDRGRQYASQVRLPAYGMVCENRKLRQSTLSYTSP